MTLVLIAEDNQTLLENMALELELRGYEVLQAVDGHGALNILRTSERLPDIVVSDIAMPDIDGYKLLETVRSDPQWNAIPFLFLTAFNSPNSIRISKELGVDDYIVKPFQADDLVLAIENKLRRIAAFSQAAHQKLDSVRRQLLDMLSHELRTPLVSIFGGAELLADHLAHAPEPFVHSMLSLIQSGAHRMNRLTGNALLLLQLDSGYLERVYPQASAVYDMVDIAQDAQRAVDNDTELSDRQVSIELRTASQPLPVAGVYEYLVKMVEELLRNAVAFSHRGSSVQLDLTCDGGQVVVTVRDQGVGISQEHLPLVWERFTQINRQDQEQQGAGMGLSLVRDSARIHGGGCALQSQLGHGTTATLWLPLAAQ
jgi:signal transduction histidine kinase